MRQVTSRVLVLFAAVALILGVAGPALAAPEGTMTWGVHITLASRWLDPAETEGIITPFMVLYALHDALVKPMPAGPNTPSLAESWSQSKDGLTYEFVLRKGVKFHNGDPVTAADVKFSFERYKGSGAKLLKERVREVQIVDPGRVRFDLKEPWPDFMTFYGTSATGASWVVPKAYVEKVGDDGFKKAPIGAGPYKFVSFNPGIELVMEAYEGYWRKVPNVKRLVYRSMPEETTRAAALKKGEVDIAYLLTGPVAEDIQRTPGFKLVAPKESPGHLLARSPRPVGPEVALARPARAPGGQLRHRPAGPQPGRDARLLDAHGLAHPPRPGVLALLRARSLRSRRGPRSSSPRPAIPAASTPATSIRGRPTTRWARRCPRTWPRSASARKLRIMERAALTTAWRERKLKNVIVGITGAGGNAATRLEAYVSKNGVYTAGIMPDVEDLFQRQARETDVKKREALLHQIQQILHERVTQIPIYELAFIWGVGPRVDEPGINLIRSFAYSAPLEDVRLKRP